MSALSLAAANPKPHSRWRAEVTPAGRGKARVPDLRPAALLVYLLVVVNAAAFVARPLQQIPPCF